ncbi:Protein fam49a [Allomyces javanicus]|nr:Protein fam49a [Allomyces javanicus]
MGQLLALLLHPSVPAPPPLVAVDLLNPAVTPDEQELLVNVQTVLDEASTILRVLKNYHGCEDVIRSAISSPGQQTESAAWDAVVPCVLQLRQIYEYALKIEQVLPSILEVFCRAGPDGQVDVQKNLETNQATAKAFADIVSFSWEFDDVKMSKPAIQNDFSYYRRTLQRTRALIPGAPNATGPGPIPVGDELANRMSLFYAYPSPFLKLITDTVTQHVGQHHVQVAVANYLMLIAGVCHNAVNTQSSVPALFALRVMTSCLVMYDHIHPVGLFPKNSEANVRLFIRTIQTHGGASSATLLNSLRYSSKTFNNADVPKATKALFEGSLA